MILRSIIIVVLAAGTVFAQKSAIPTDIEGALFALSRRARPKVDLDNSRAQLRVFQIELKMALADLAAPKAKVAAIANYFFKEQLFSASADLSNPENFYLDDVLTKKQGYCLSLSAVILTVARRLKLPIHGVATPRHFFCRWDDGKTRFNIETTENGRLRSNAFYRGRGVTSAAEKAGIYLTNLTDAQVVGYLINNEGFVDWHSGDAARAESRFREAMNRVNPFPEAMINLGVVAGDRGENKKAQTYFDKALVWMPGDTGVIFNRVLGAVRSGRVGVALQKLDEEIFKPGRADAMADYRHLLLSTIMRPPIWENHQKKIVAAAEEERKAGKLAAGIRGTYFSDHRLERRVATRIDRVIEFEWRWSSPHRLVPADDFSVRWDGYVDLPNSGVWKFMTVVNDGIRVWVDGVRIIDNWKSNEGALDHQTLPLEKGLHAIRVEYFERRRFAGIQFKVKRVDKDRTLGRRSFFHRR